MRHPKMAQRKRREFMRTSETVTAIFSALSKAQRAVDPVYRNTKAYNYKYAPLDVVMKSARDAMGENGLAVFQSVTPSPDGVFCVTRLAHESGEWIETDCPMFFKPDSKTSDAQAFGSAYTYARRYSIQALLGIAPADDDGASAGKGTQHPRNARKSKNSTPQQYPSVPANALQSVMGWGELPPMTKTLQGLADKVESEGLVHDQILAMTRIRILKLLETLGPIEGRKWSTETTQSMRSVGNTEECVDLVAMCALIDALENEAAHNDAAPF